MPTLKKAVAAACLHLPVRETLVAAAEIGADGVQFDVRNELRPSDLSQTGRRQFLKFAAELNLALPSFRFSSAAHFMTLTTWSAASRPQTRRWSLPITWEPRF